MKTLEQLIRQAADEYIENKYSDYSEESKAMISEVFLDGIRKGIELMGEAHGYTHISVLCPTKEYSRCKIITNKGRILEVDYWEDQGIFFDDEGNEIGWIGDESNRELVIYWKEILKTNHP